MSYTGRLSPPNFPIQIIGFYCCPTNDFYMVFAYFYSFLAVKLKYYKNDATLCDIAVSRKILYAIVKYVSNKNSSSKKIARPLNVIDKRDAWFEYDRQFIVQSNCYMCHKISIFFIQYVKYLGTSRCNGASLTCHMFSITFFFLSRG